jgi:chitodextrinase
VPRFLRLRWLCAVVLSLVIAALVGASSSGGALGAIAPPTPTGLAVTDATEQSVSLSWDASGSPLVTGYDVYQDGSGIGSTAATAYTVSGLHCGQMYSVGVDSVDLLGNRSAPAILEAQTKRCPDTQAPSAPANLTATATRRTISLSWSASTDNVGVAGYTLYSNGTQVATQTGTSYAYGGLRCGTSYTLAVDAYDAGGNHSARTSGTFTTSACPDTQAPTAPTGLAATSTGQTSLDVAWSASTDNVGVAGYTVYRDGTQIGTQTGTSITMSDLTCGATYTVGVDAYDAAGNHSTQTSGTFTTGACSPDTQPPSAPTGLTATSTNQTTITIAWNASTDDTSVTGYGIYRNGSLRGTQTGRSYAVTGLACGTTYTLGVDAFDAAGNHSARTSGSFATAACPGDTQPPSGPTGLASTSTGQTTIAVTWTAATDDVGVTGYTLYRDGSQVATQSGTSYTYTGLTCGTTYTLAVDAYDAAGNHSGKATSAFTTTACPDTQPPTAPTGLAATSTTQTSVSVRWTASTDNVGVTGYTLYRNGVQSGTQGSTSYTYTALACGTTYTLAVDAYDAAGNHSTKASGSFTTSACPDTQAPAPPTGLQTSNVTQTGLSLSWTASTDNVGVGGYDVFANGSKLGTTTGTSYTATGLTCGTSYTLGVVAFDAAGNRSAQASTSASTTGCSAPPAGTANLWIDTTGGTCTRQAMPGAYNDAQACGGLQAAANAASSGDLILIKDGTYPGEQLTGSKTLTFQGAGPGRPSFGQILTSASNITVRHLLVQNRSYPTQTVCSYWDYTLYVCGANETFDDVIVDGMDKGKAQGDSSRLGAIQIDSSATNFVFKNGEIKAIRDNKGIQGGADGMLIENNLIHDVGLTQAGQNAGVHLECAAVTDGANQVWRRNTFYDCSVINWVAQNFVGGPAFGPVTLENNVFAHPMLDDVNGSWQNGAPCLTIVGGNNGTNAVNNWVVRFNTFECGISVGTPSSADDNHSAKWYGNLGTDPGCGAPEWTMSYNVGAVCSSSPGSVVVANGVNSSGSPNQAPFYVDAPNHNFHLKAGVNAAVNVGAPTYPAVDRDGNARPFGASVDAGAYERQS